MPVIVGGRVFRTRTDALEQIRHVRDRYPLGAVVTDGDDQEFLLELLALHPEAAEKFGPGVEHFEVRQNGSTVGFWIIRTDGSETDFSFIRCLRAPRHDEEVRAAMREAVRDQKLAARDAAFANGEVRCPITGELLTPQTCHVHHDEREFLELADAFAGEIGGYERIEVVAGDGVIGRRLVDEDLKRRWQEFHERNARLVVVSVRANLSHLRLGRFRRP